MAERRTRFVPEYSTDDVLGLYRTRVAEGDEARLRRLATQFRTHCRLEQEVSIPGTYRAISREIRTPFMRDAWHRIASSLVAKRPVVHITPRDDRRSDYRQAANIAERWDTALIERLNKQMGMDLDYALAAQLVRDGESVLKVVHRPDAWARFPDGATTQEQDEYKRGVDLPIAWRDVDRMSVVYEGGEYGDAWVIEYGEYTRPLLRARYGYVEVDGRLVDPERSLEGRPIPEGLQASAGRCVKVEFFTPREWHVIVEGAAAPGFPRANPYAPYLPYFRAPAYDAESLLYSLLFLVPRLDEALTMKLTWSVLGAYPNPVIETLPNQGGLPSLELPLGDAGDVAGSSGEQRLVWAPGKALDLPAGKRLSFLAPPAVGKDLNDMVVLLKSLIDVAGIPSIMRGIAGSGDSGYLANQLRAAAEMSYKLATISLQRQREKALEFTHWVVANVVRQTVYVLGWSAINPRTGRPMERASQGWLGLSPEAQSKNVAAISKLGPVTCQYRPTLPTDDQARAMIALQLTNAAKPLYDRRHALETWMQEEDPDAILDAIAVETALSEEPLRGMVIQEALQEAGMVPAPAPPPSGLLGPTGAPLPSTLGAGPGAGMVPPGPSDLQPVPLANQAPPGVPGVPGLTMPLVPQPPPARGMPVERGGRAPGTYPGLPGGPRR